jgi:uncharacterized repeat protein (TIGR01451 family)
MTSGGTIHARVSYRWIAIALLFICVLSLLSTTPVRARGVHTVTVSLSSYEFDKTVADLTSGANPAKTAAPGDKLRYTLRFRTTTQALTNFSIFDDMDALNTQAYFAPGTLTLVTFPAAGDIGATSSAGGTKGTGVIDIRNLSLPVNGEVLIQFDITLKPGIAGAVVTNQATLRLDDGTSFAWSNDPNVNGTADPTVASTAVPTRVKIASGGGGGTGGGTGGNDSSASDPALVLTKSGPTTMSLGQLGTFGFDVQNTGLDDAWDVTLRDLLPHGATGGMCDRTPAILSAQVFAADGATAVPGKGPLNRGSDYSLSYSGAPNCQLDITMLTAAATISPNQHLIIRYQTQLDANTQNGVALTNVAGAIEWFNADSTNNTRKSYPGIVTNGTPGIPDNQDAHTVTAAFSGYEFDKTVADLTSGENPATSATPGDKLRYTLRFRTTTQALSNFSIFDDMDALNAQAAFAPGTLTLVTSPAGADISATSSTGGTKGTGVIDIRNLSLAVNSQALIQFDIILKPAIANGTVVTNQATLRLANGTTFAWSNDPNVKGAVDPTVANSEAPTRVTIVSSASDPVLVLTKSGPATMSLGQLGSFGLDIQNIGLSDAWNVTLHDLLPRGATGGMCDRTPTILSAQVFAADGITPVPRKDPLTQGSDYSFSYNAAPNCQLNLTMLTAAATIGPNQHLIIRYQTQLDANSQNGVTLTNVAGAIQWFNTNSSNPIRKSYTGPLTNGTPGILDNQDAHTLTVTLSSYEFDKTVADLTSGTNPATTAAPGDKLRYTLRFRTTTQALSNFSIFDDMDALDAQAAFAPGTLTLVTFPAGVDISATSSTSGTKGTGVIDIRNLSLAVNSQALIQFDMTLKPAIAIGTVVNNQATLRLANGTTFAWSDDPNVNGIADPTVPNGEDPTRVTIVVGAVQQLSISNQVTVVGGGPAVPGAQLEYLVHVVNNGAVPATNVVITDDLNASQPGQLGYVNLSATMNGSAAGVSFAGSTITINYAAINGPLAPGGFADLRFRTTLNPSLVPAIVVTNTGVAAWNSPTQTASASVSIVVGGIAGVAVLNGSAWYDANFDNVQDSGERALAGWAVDLYRDNQLSQSVQTDVNGVYRIIGVEPNDTSGVRYELRFRAPGAGPNTARLGRAASPFTNALQRISDIIVPYGANLQGLNLPIHPNGVIYNSVARTPVAGATLTLLDTRSASPLPAGCFDDAAQQGQITLADGYYKFDINFGDPACPSGGDYLIGVTAPAGTNYVAGYSQLIPPTSSASSAAFSVPACPGSAADAIPSTALFCEAQPSEFAPSTPVPLRSAGTKYYVHLMLDGTRIPGTSQIFNNHIPLDPEIAGSITITKTTPLVNVSRGQLVPYTITANNRSGLMLTDVSIVDRLPAGFSYIKGSALLDGVPTEPSVSGLVLSWDGLTIAGTQVRTVKLLVAVGAGGSQGEYVNRAQAMNAVTGIAISGEATATVRLVPDPTFDCTDVMGKVYNDKNRNGRQDEGEEGLAGVRVVTPQGLQAATDQYGRYHITCAITPNESRGSNFVLKLDDRTLPSGFRMSTDQVQIQRATSGKAVRIDFGAAIHRVVSIDLLDAAFEPRTTTIRVQWRPRINLLLEELYKAPSVLRLSYIADTEDEALVKRRVEAVRQQLTEVWDSAKYGYVLTIETEVFWRRGAAPKRPPEKR